MKLLSCSGACVLLSGLFVCFVVSADICTSAGQKACGCLIKWGPKGVDPVQSDYCCKPGTTFIRGGDDGSTGWVVHEGGCTAAPKSHDLSNLQKGGHLGPRDWVFKHEPDVFNTRKLETPHIADKYEWRWKGIQSKKDSKHITFGCESANTQVHDRTGKHAIFEVQQAWTIKKDDTVTCKSAS